MVWYLFVVMHVTQVIGEHSRRTVPESGVLLTTLK